MQQRLILSPLRIERDLILKTFSDQGYSVQEEKAGPLTVHVFPALNIRVSLAGHGKTQFGIQTQFLLQYYQDVSSVFCAGCAGALRKDLEIGDVILAEKTIEHDYRIKFIDRPLPVFTGDKEIIKDIMARPKEGFRIHVGVIASGDEDVVDSQRAQEIANQTGASAVAWEGAGGARACQFNKVPFVEIRGITDHADSDVPYDFLPNLEKAMKNVAICLINP